MTGVTLIWHTYFTCSCVLCKNASQWQQDLHEMFVFELFLKRKRLLNWEHSKKGNEVGRSQNYSRRISKKDSNVVNLVNPTSPQKRQNVLWQTMAMYVWLFVSSFQHEAQGFPPSSLPPHCLPASRSARGVCATGDASSRTRKILRWIGHFPVWYQFD